jgi:hypothetical protein
VTGAAIAFASLYGIKSTEFITIKASGMTASVALAALPVYYLAKDKKLKERVWFRIATAVVVFSMIIWFF